ncbi:MAG: hypothetical protein DWQ04_33375 [Chloroflexi bacterium]|nr:MAG: hypothetical protein DWQ04_33375 [Chloroflexota bacterium]
MRFTNFLLVFVVAVVIIGSPLSAFGCRTLAPNLISNLEPPCEDDILFESLSVPGVANYLNYTLTLITVVGLAFISWNMPRQMLPVPTGCKCAPPSPPPRFG